MTRSSSAGSGTEVEAPTLLQTGPESFVVLLGDGVQREVRLAHHTRRGLGLVAVPPLQVATEAVRIVQERGELLAGDGVLDLGVAVGRDPAGMEELRMRLA
ncbi:MAG: hypothetical protein ACNA8R_00855 [Nitriliruptoraceae bacterium]